MNVEETAPPSEITEEGVGGGEEEEEVQKVGARLDLLGVSVHWLCTGVVEEIQSSGLDYQTSCMHDLEDLQHATKFGIARRRSSLMKSPVDGRLGSAYVHCLKGDDKVGLATHILSYTWSYKFGDIINTLNEFCTKHHLDPKTTYIWIDLLCINQHRVVEAKKNGDTGLLNFEEEFPNLLGQIGHMLVLMSPWNKPLYLERIWCIFEMYTAHVLKECDVTIIIPSKEKIALENDLFGDQGSLDALYEALGSTKVQNADASFEKDRQFILEMIEKGVGCTTLNNVVNEFLRCWVRNVLNEVIEGRLLVAGSAGQNDDDSSSPHAALLTYKIGNFLRHNGEYDVALNWMNKSLALYEAHVDDGDDHEEGAAKCYIGIGDILSEKGDYEGALTQYHTAERMYLSTMGPGTTSACYQAIGKTLVCKADYDGALIQCRKALDIRQEAYGMNHPDTGESYGFIGLVHGHKGDNVAALEGHRKAAAIYESVYGTDHPKTACAYNDIGNELGLTGDYDGALVEFSKALKIRESVLGADHPMTSNSYNNIGNMLSQKHDIDGALVSYKKSLAIREALLGDDHPKTARSYNNIANLLATKGDLDRALEMYHKAHLIRSKTLGTNHPETANSHFNIGRVLSRKGDEDDALVELQTALEIYNSTYGYKHRSIADTYFMIGKVLSKKGDHKGALLKCRKAHSIYEGLQHPKKGSTARYIAKLEKWIENLKETETIER